MKHVFSLVCLFILISSFSTVSAQDERGSKIDKSLNYFYDHLDHQLTNTATIPDFDSKSEKIKITGTIFESDGVTPASDVILYIFQPDESGYFEYNSNDDKNTIQHRGWIKTDKDGQYTFYTFVPSTDIRNNKLRKIHAIAKTSNGIEYNPACFLFDDDPRLSKFCRKKVKRIDSNSILKFEKSNDLLVANRDIVLNTGK